MIKGCIFDFNGTLFYDGAYNQYAWEKIINEISESKIDFVSFYETKKGLRNAITIEDCYKKINKKYTKEDIERYIHLKEVYYQSYILDNGLVKFADNAEELLNYLKEKDIKMNIATSSIKYNCDFYFNEFHLDRWFVQDNISYDNGLYNDKEEMYKDAAKKIGVDLKDCIVFEDSIKGIEEAIKAGCEKIVFINSQKLNYHNSHILFETTDYSKIDRRIFE